MKLHPATRAALLLLTLAPFPAKALDLTPRSGTRELETVKIPIVLFTDDDKTIGYKPPVTWKMSGGGKTLSLYPPELQDTVMQLRLHPRKLLPAGQAEDLEQWSRTLLPGDATNVTLESTAPNVFTLDTRGSLEFTYSYAATGRRFLTSIALVDWNEKERLTVIVTARSTDFKAIHNTGIGSLFSWRRRE